MKMVLRWDRIAVATSWGHLCTLCNDFLDRLIKGERWLYLIVMACVRDSKSS